MEVTLLAAFLGGVLALLSPCGALLLPAFFAATSASRRRLLRGGALFFLGLLLTLVPLGLGASVVGTLLTARRDLLITIAGGLIIAFGVLQLLGLGFDISRGLPGATRLRAAAPRVGEAGRAVLLGTVSGVAGFCSGPILGAVLTMAATEPSRLLAGTMLGVYGAGMVVPLVLIAATWARLGERGRSRLRGRAWRVGPLRLHTTSTIGGLLLIAVGAVFLRTNGMATLPQLIPAGTLGRLQSAVLSLGTAVPEPLLIVLAALAALAIWWLVQRRRTAGGPLRRRAEPPSTGAAPWPEALGLVTTTAVAPGRRRQAVRVADGRQGPAGPEESAP